MLGGIPLQGLTVIEKDVSLAGNDGTCPLSRSDSSFTSCIVSPTDSLPHHHHPRFKRNSQAGQLRSRIVLVTAMGVRYELEASNADERDSWASFFRVASKLV